ncbi:hypothetical protein HK105_207604 [Polyrhizophydium stewartii]|uniref:Importin N-terminal domain-containing protein n=1 Tax=Polyrhizophydium stewartii TaxID=2732419 RepID=A0ABR4N0D5_9FUNG
MAALIELARDKVLSPLIGAECAGAVAAIDLARDDCFKLLLSKGLSLGIVVGSSILKVPQIINILAAGSAEGLSFLSVFVETVSIAITVAFNYRLHNPFSAYGENVFVSVQNLAIMFLILVYRGRYGALVSRGIAIGLFGAALFSERVVSMGMLETLQWGTIFLVVPSKVPQIMANHRARSTGTLSFITVFLQFAGTLARVFTTLQEGLHSALLFSFVAAAVLNGVLLLQFALYPGLPNHDDLARLVHLFVQSTQGNSTVQQQVMQQLRSLSTVPDFPNYLAYIFALTTQPVPVRTVAGLTLKNSIREAGAAPHPQALDFVKAACLQALADQEPIIRSTSGTVITTIHKMHPNLWPEVVPKLLEFTEAGNGQLTEGSMDALRKICEDSCNELDEGDPNVFAYLIQKLLQHMRHENPKVRTAAIESLNQFILMRAEPLFVHLNTFIATIYQLTSDTTKSVRRAICQSLVLVFEVAPEAIIPELNNVVNFMLFCTQDDEETVALEASEFWLAFAEQESYRDHLEPYLPQIVPILIKGMIYSEEEIMMLGGDEDDADRPDNAQDVKPHHHRSRNHGSGHASRPEAGDGNDDFDDEDDGDDGDDDVDNEWNVRKCSAASIDVMATVFRDSLLPVLLPLLKDQLSSAEWSHREAGILALGAIAEGCSVGMIPHLPSLVPMLLATLKDKKPLVRSITCWTLGRYASWVVHGDPRTHNITEEQRRQHLTMYFEPMLQSLLTMVLDNNKRVQETGCSALAILEEFAGELLVPYLGPILQTLATAFPRYQHKNLLILYDCLGTLADAVGPSLNNPQLIELFMPCLTTKWGQLPDDDSGLFPLFECLSSIAIALGPGFAPYAQVVWARSLHMINNGLVQYENYTRNPEHVVEPEKDFIVVSQDLLSGVTQGLGAAVQPLLASGSPTILDLLSVCLKVRFAAWDRRTGLLGGELTLDGGVCPRAWIQHPYPEVRQSACALLGDFAINAFDHIKPRINEYMQNLIPLIQSVMQEELSTAISNNAAWATGEIALKATTELQVWVQPLLERLVAILMSRSKPTLKENAAITIGRLGISYAALIAPALDSFAQEWCQALARIRDNLEKESAFQGFCQIILANPNGLVNHFVYFCDAVVQWSRISPELNETFRQVLTMYANGMGSQWGPTLETYPVHIRQRLKERYNL